ncbi:nucleolar pre-ribosomal-associated protein 1 [Parasteatoda tepidariorum]|uniref:nucleolar pre-ribosomal-associated protein 1 n=1 Tax=Parasteatoda tepidariorum TaxID=114398 RepID=UPI00077FD985|nr:nucleolar pre-ribosomal-associated protein 1 [Parasteatoda tepidariorum]
MEEKINAEFLYNAFIKNDNSYKYLHKFVSFAEEFNESKSNYDIVKEYLQFSNSCDELLPFVKELANADSQNVGVVLKAMCHILIRVAGDLHVHEAAGTKIVKDVLLHGMRLIFQYLRPQKRPAQARLALHLLASMVALSKQVATQVVAKLDFSHVNFTHLLFNTNTRAEEDVRSAFLNLLVLVITICDNNVIRQIVEVKGLLNNVFPGLLTDHASTITLVLNTFRSKIVENIDIPKTCKLRLFNEHSLKFVIELYSWRGPLKKKKFMKRKLGEDAKPLCYEVGDEEAKEVQLCAHQFMLSLCSSVKYGIIFRDPSLGSSGRNFNSVITNILKCFTKPFADELSSEFVISVLKACPDQVKFFLPLLKDSFAPRISVLWVKAIEFFEKAIRSLDVTSYLFKSGTKFPMPTLTSISKTFCLPGLLSISTIEETFILGHPVLGYYVSNYLSSLLEQIKSVLDFCEHPTSDLYDPSELAAFRKAFLPLALRNLPITRGLESFWNKIVSGENIWLKDEALSGFPSPSCFEQLFAVLKVMKVFQEIYQNSQNNHSFNFLQMLHSLQKFESLTKKELLLVRIELVDLIATQQQGTILLAKEDSKSIPFPPVLDVYLTAEEPEEILMATHLIHKVLWHTKLFDNCKWEIEVWLDAIKSTKSQDLSAVFELLSDSLKVSLAQPNLVSFESFDVQGPVNSINEITDPLEMLKGIIDEDNDDHSGALEVEPIEYSSERFCFSNLVPAILQQFASLNKKDKKVCRPFVENALLLVLHRQFSTETLFELVKKYEDSLDSTTFAYFDLLHSLKRDIQVDSLISKTQSDACEKNLSEHLQQIFVILLKSDKGNACSCTVDMTSFNPNQDSARNILWQLLSYINFELKHLLEFQDKESSLLIFIDFLQKLYGSLKPYFQKEEHKNFDMEKSSDISSKNAEINLEGEILSHPAILKLFLQTENTPKCISKLLKKASRTITKLVLDITQDMMSFNKEEHHLYIRKYKQKVLNYIHESSSNLKCDELDLLSIIGAFSSFYSSREIVLLLENLPNVQQSESSFSLLVLLVKQYLETKNFITLSPSCVDSLVLKYSAMSKKQKKIFIDIFLEVFHKHPAYGLHVNKDSFWLLLEHRSDKDLNVLGALIELNKELRQLTQVHLGEITEDFNNFSFMFLTSRCLSMCDSEDEQDQKFKTTISDVFWNSITQFLNEELEREVENFKFCKADKAVQNLLQENFISSKKLSKFWKSLLGDSKSLESAPAPSKMSVLLQLLKIWKTQRCEKGKSLIPVLQIIFSWMTICLPKFQEYIDLIAAIKNILQDLDEITLSDFLDVIPFFQKALKVSMKCDGVGVEILKILSVLCAKSRNVNLPVQNLHDLVIGHSNFFNIILTDVKNDASLKEGVIELLTVLAKLDVSVCKEQHIGIFLGAYHGTMSRIDQKLLYLIKIYSDNGVNMIKYSPFLWGKAAIAHYSIVNSGEHLNLSKQAKLKDIASLISSEKIEKTILHYPLKMALQLSLEFVEDIDKELACNIYDLRFFLPLLANLLSPGSYVNIHCFLESKLLFLVFISLSSYDSDLRALGYYCLSQFYHHLESWRSQEKEVWISLLECLRNDISSSNPKLPCIITLFLVRVTEIFNKPSNSLYPILYKFIMTKPALDVTHVPEFYKLFNSVELEHRIQRLWLLSLLADGLRTSVDFHICEKRYIFSIMKSLCWSTLSSQQEKISVLRVILSAVKIESSARTLCQNGLLVWLHNILEQCEMTDEISPILKDIFENVSKADAENGSLMLLQKLKEHLLKSSLLNHHSSTVSQMDIS